MSRGPGRWQRIVLDLVAEQTESSGLPAWVTVDDVLARSLSVDSAASSPVTQHLVAEREAARRAIRTLWDAHRIDVAYVRRERPYSPPFARYRRTAKRRVLAARRALCQPSSPRTARSTAVPAPYLPLRP